jgi:hypothetical protein
MVDYIGSETAFPVLGSDWTVGQASATETQAAPLVAIHSRTSVTAPVFASTATRSIEMPGPAST